MDWNIIWTDKRCRSWIVLDYSVETRSIRHVTSSTYLTYPGLGNSNCTRINNNFKKCWIVILILISCDIIFHGSLINYHIYRPRLTSIFFKLKIIFYILFQTFKALFPSKSCGKVALNVHIQNIQQHFHRNWKYNLIMCLLKVLGP